MFSIISSASSLYLLLFPIVVDSIYFQNKNETLDLCSNGAKPGNDITKDSEGQCYDLTFAMTGLLVFFGGKIYSILTVPPCLDQHFQDCKNCSFIQSSGYECSSSNSSASWCENFNGTYKCCEKSRKPCEDRSAFCRLTKHLCNSRSNFKTMKARCDLSCGFCGIESFEQAQQQKIKMRQAVENVQECSEPRKCVFPREKMLTTPKSRAENAKYDASKDPIAAFRSRINISSSSTNTTTTTQKTSSSSTNSTPPTLQMIFNSSTVELSNFTTTSSENYTTDESLNSTTSPRLENATTLTPAKKLSTKSEVRKISLEELMTTRDSMPKITTARPSDLSTSLTKTVIQGTCFDEYVYCREFASLCSHPTFSDVMASHCSLTCNRCDEVERIETGTENCADITPDCASYKDLCDNSKYQRLMKNYCTKSCGHCVPMCRDRHQNCPQFAEDGFCEDQMYTKDEIQYLCGNTCKLC